MKNSFIFLFFYLFFCHLKYLMSLMLFHRSQGTANKKKVLNLKFKWNRNVVTHVYFSSVCDLLYLRLRIKYTSYCYQCLYLLSGYTTNYTATETWYLGCKLFSYILSLGKRYFCGWEKMILYEILTKSLSVAHTH